MKYPLGTVIHFDAFDEVFIVTGYSLVDDMYSGHTAAGPEHTRAHVGEFIDKFASRVKYPNPESTLYARYLDSLIKIERMFERGFDTEQIRIALAATIAIVTEEARNAQAQTT